MSDADNSAPARRLPVVYGGMDAGPRPETRQQVYAALVRGVQPSVVAEHVARGVSDLWQACRSTLESLQEVPACAKGCSFCCHQRVEVTAAEVFVVARYLSDHATESEVDRLRRAAGRNAELSSAEHFQTQTACPFLGLSGECRIYAVRPLACRRAHSLDRQICERLASDPTLDLAVPYSATLGWNTSALVLGYYEGLLHANRPPHQYELVQAVCIALAEDDAEQRWNEGDDVFASAQTHSAEELAMLLQEMEAEPV